MAAGYTLMELLAVLSIIAIMASVGLPAVDNFFSAQRVAAEANTFIQNVRLAKYQAMETQIYHRLAFLADGSGYRLSVYEKPGFWNYPTAVHDLADANNPTSIYWVDITGEGIILFDSIVQVATPPAVPLIFFRPDGLLVSEPSDNADPIPDCLATFTYGTTALTVNLTQIGVRASEEYYEE